MNVLVLGGNSPHHYQWVRDVAHTLERKGHTVLLHDYKHWKTGAHMASILDEVADVSAQMSGRSGYVVIAKSIGTVIATLAIASGGLHPSRCILLGVPYKGIAGETKTFLPSLPALPRTVFIQNEHDPFGDAEGLDALLESSHPSTYDLVVMDGNSTHDYTDYELLEKMLR